MAGEADGGARPPRREWALLARRLSSPKGQFSFWIFLLIGIVVLGGLAIWIEAYRYANSAAGAENAEAELAPLKLALATAGLAIGGPAVMQLFYSRDKMAIVAAIVLFTLDMFFALYLMSFGTPGPLATIATGLLCLGPAILAWVLANGEDPIFQDAVDDFAATGGDPMRRLPEGRGADATRAKY